MNTTNAKDMFYLERHRDLLERRINGLKGCLNTKLGYTPANLQHLEELQKEHADVFNEIAAFNNYVNVL